MLNKRVPQRQLWAWILLAVSAPLTIAAGKSSWIWVIGIGVVCSLVCWAQNRLSEENPIFPKWYCVVQIVWLVVMLTCIANMSIQCWPANDAPSLISVSLLVLAMVSARSGVERASGISSVLIWLTAILYIIIFVGGTQNIKLQRITADIEALDLFLIPVFLMPATASLLHREKGRCDRRVLTISTLFALLVSLWTAGTVSSDVARRLEYPFYEFTKSLSVLGVAERFESLAAVGLTISIYSAMTLFLSTAYALGEQLQEGVGGQCVLISGVLAAVFNVLGIELDASYLAVLSVLLWGIMPLILPLKNKLKKVEKSP